MTKDNEIIARFMGMKPKEEIDLDGWWINTIPVHPYESIIFDAIKFEKSWDWLMPVVEKIESLFGGSLIFSIRDTRCFIVQDTQYAVVNGFNDDIPECYSGFHDSKIEAVHCTIIHFLNWYNQNNTTNA